MFKIGYGENLELFIEKATCYYKLNILYTKKQAS